MQKNEVGPFCYSADKWIPNLNVRAKTTKFLEENTGEKHDTGFGNDFMDRTLKAQAPEEKHG